MNHSYESVKETMITQGIDVPESYIEKALREYGFDKFPEAGLEDSGLTKLVKRATDIAHAEAQLIPRKSKQGHLPVQKIKKEKESKLKEMIQSAKNNFIFSKVAKSAVSSLVWAGIAYGLGHLMGGDLEAEKMKTFQLIMPLAGVIMGQIYYWAICNDYTPNRPKL
jgi:hypothetical protein